MRPASRSTIPGMGTVLGYVGLVTVVLAVIGLIRGHLAWARIPSRKAAGMVLAVGVIVTMVGSVLTPRSPAPVQSIATLPASSPSQSASSAPATTTTPAPAAPPEAAFVGQSKAITADGAGALVTLNGIRYTPLPNNGPLELAVVDISLQGTSAAPYHYSETDLAFSYADDRNPYTHVGNTHIYGPSPLEDYTPYMPPSPLRVGQVGMSQQVRGLVILRLTSHSHFILSLNSPSSSKSVAAWALTSS